MRAAPFASRTGTTTAVPRIARGCCRRISSSVPLAIASMNPLPSVLVDRRNVRMSSSKSTSSAISGSVERECTSDPPSDSKNSPSSRRPVRCSAIWLARPGHDVLVAFAAGLRVVGRAQSVGDRFHFLEDEAVVVEGPERHDRLVGDRLERRPLRVHAVGLAVEAGGRLRRVLVPHPLGFLVDLPYVGESLAALVVAACVRAPLRAGGDDRHAQDQTDGGYQELHVTIPRWRFADRHVRDQPSSCLSPEDTETMLRNSEAPPATAFRVA